jgi:hypothetical protein
MKTSELTGAALDWAVAKCEKLDASTDRTGWSNEWAVFVDYSDTYCGVHYQPSVQWGWAGSIIEREKIRLDTSWNGEDGTWSARMDTVGGWWCGATPLVAAMRCYVASQLGDEIDLPEELL